MQLCTRSRVAPLSLLWKYTAAGSVLRHTIEQGWRKKQEGKKGSMFLVLLDEFLAPCVRSSCVISFATPLLEPCFQPADDKCRTCSLAGIGAEWRQSAVIPHR